MGVTAVKVYSPQDGTTSVHASHVIRCSPAFPAGSYWYGGPQSGLGCFHDGWINWSMMKQKQTRQAQRPEGLIQMQLRDRRVSWWGADILEGELSEIDTELPEKDAWTISTVGDLCRDPQVHPENLLAELLWWFRNQPNSKMSFFWRRNNVTHVAFGLKENL